jgi:membrane protein insertase Oxa1/YidC/SpoIIIJ
VDLHVQPPSHAGVLLYWLTSNIWTLVQQGYVIRYHPPTDEQGGPDRPTGGGSDVRSPGT